MFFKSETVYKGFKTVRGAQAYIDRFLSNSENIRIAEINGMFWVVG